MPPEKSRQRLLGGLLALVLIAGTTTAAVSLVATITRDRIAANQSARALRTVVEVLPRDAYNNSPDQDVTMLNNAALLGSPKPQPAYRARSDDSPAAVALTVTAPDGYIAPIKLLVGVDGEGNVIAVRALNHLETPGLGDQIDIGKSAWIEQFSGRSLSGGNGALALRRDGGDLDQISGATITSRAVSKAVRNALKYYAQNREQIFAPDSASEQPSKEH
jgi:Na+-translocating ferredoxin:NAD+ oxidoreductase subunit G